MKVRFEFKIEDSWVGMYWKRSTAEVAEVADDKRTAVLISRPKFDLWICIVPWFPLHFTSWGTETRSQPMRYVGD